MGHNTIAWKAYRFMLAASMIFAQLAAIGQIPELPAWIQDTVYIDPTVSGEQNGSIEKPFSGVGSEFTSRTAYLFKRGTKYFHPQVIAFASDSIVVSCYGPGAKPILEIYTTKRCLIFSGTEITVSYLTIQCIDDTLASATVNVSGKGGRCLLDSLVVYGSMTSIEGGGFEKLTIRNCVVSRSFRDGIGVGGSDTLLITGCHVFDVNRIWQYPEHRGNSGGDCIQSERNKYVHIENCLLDHLAYEGKFPLISNVHDTITVINCTMLQDPGNSAFFIGGSARGGSVINSRFYGGNKGVLSKSSCQIVNCLFKNQAEAGADVAGKAELMNNTFINMKDGITGWATTIYAYNNIFYNVGEPVRGELEDADYNCYYYPPETPYKIRIPSIDAHAIEADPLFMDAASGDFRLKETSPVIGKGMETQFAYDQNGIQRTGVFDMGAYQYTPDQQPLPVVPNTEPEITLNLEPFYRSGIASVLNASKSSDVEGDNLVFTWQLPDSIHQWLALANSSSISFVPPLVDDTTLMPITLLLSDGFNTVSEDFTLKIAPYNTEINTLDNFAYEVSNSTDDNTPDRLFDNDMGTYWKSVSINDYCLLTLDEPSYISHLQLSFGRDASYYYYGLMLSEDNKDWTVWKYSTRTFVIARWVNEKIPLTEIIPINPELATKKYKYIKIIGFGNDTYDYITVRELSLFGSEDEAATDTTNKTYQPYAFQVDGGAVICPSEETSVTVDGSELAIGYHLLKFGEPTGRVLYGNGQGLTFNHISETGLYSVRAQTKYGIQTDLPGKAKVLVIDNKLHCPDAVTLKKGWNLISCPIGQPMAIPETFAQIWDKVEGVKNEDVFYLKGQPAHFNSLHTIAPLGAYFIKVSSNCMVVW